MNPTISIKLVRTLCSAIVLCLAAAGNTKANDIVKFETVFDTDYVTAGTGGMRGNGNGTIVLSGINGPVRKAYLYWQGPTNSSSPTANASVTVNGTTVIGVNIGFSNDNCWGFNNSQAYRADVTSLVQSTGNGTYTLTNFVKAGGVDINGVSLIVFFDDGNEANDRDIVIFNGNDSNIDNPFDAPGWNVTLAGIVYASGTARLQMHVSDGQAFLDDAVKVNNTVLLPTGAIFQGTLGPSTQNGSLWDIRNIDVTSLLTPGPNTLSMTTGVNNDCLSLVVAIIDLPAGAAPCNPGAVIRVEPITSFPSCGPAAKLSPIWGQFGRKAILRSDSGETLELECVQSGINYYALYFTAANGTRLRAGLCPFEAGCNSAYFIHSGDLNNNGQPDCFARTFWRSRDYNKNDVPNPWTSEASESPARLDHAISIVDVANKHLTKKGYKYHYAVGPPVVNGCVLNPNPRPEGQFVGVRIIDPPLGPETEAFFDMVALVLGQNPPGEPMSEFSVSFGDLNADGVNDQTDLALFQSAFGSCANDPRYNPDVDLDEDDCITFADFQVWIQLFDPPTPSVDITAPTVTAPANLDVECSPGLNPGVATAVDNVDGIIPTIGLRSDGRALTDPFPAGTTIITWVAIDEAGNSAFATQEVRISDTQAPTILNASVDQPVLWPPNHSLRDVTVSYTASDNCCLTSTSISVTSNEPLNGLGDGDTEPDWVIVDDHHVKLRAERSGKGSGRIYTITITAVDCNGHTSTKDLEVKVPNSQGQALRARPKAAKAKARAA
jgi:hypothetical protein